ncbi:hypothetical protein CLAIMM_14363 [Cladophialophora immunda]|nr:hypothetical protein CLAIMM_14363 [Cladophialophora immunda]
MDWIPMVPQKGCYNTSISTPTTGSGSGLNHLSHRHFVENALEFSRSSTWDFSLRTFPPTVSSCPQNTPACAPIGAVHLSPEPLLAHPYSSYCISFFLRSLPLQRHLYPRNEPGGTMLPTPEDCLV